MAIDLRILPEQRLKMALYSCRLSPQDIEAHWRTLENSAGYEWDFDELVAFSPLADLSALTFEVAQSGAKRFVNAHNNLPMRSALVCPNPDHLASAQLFLAIASASTSQQFELKVFNDFWAALDWIVKSPARRKAKHRFDHAAISQALAELDPSGVHALDPSRYERGSSSASR